MTTNGNGNGRAQLAFWRYTAAALAGVVTSMAAFWLLTGPEFVKRDDLETVGPYPRDKAAIDQRFDHLEIEVRRLRELLEKR